MGFTTNTLLEYGNDRATLLEEIQGSLLLVITAVVNSQFYDRTRGVGIKVLENEMVAAEELIILGTQIAMAVAEYSESVSDERKVITSQDWIELDITSDGELIISCYYVLYTDITENAQVQSLTKVFKL